MASRAAPDPELTEKLKALVQRLTTALGIGHGRSAEGLAAASVAMLSKMISPYDVTKVATQQTQRALNEHAPDKEAFTAKYLALKEANVREVDKYLTVVAKIVGDKDVLATVSNPRAPPGGASFGGDEAESRLGPVVPSASAATATPRVEETAPDHSGDFEFSHGGRVSDTSGGADVSSLPMESFTFSTNPLASEEDAGTGASGGRGGGGASSSHHTPGMAGLKTLGATGVTEFRPEDANRRTSVGAEGLRHNPMFDSGGSNRGGAAAAADRSGATPGPAGGARVGGGGDEGMMTPEVRQRMQSIDLGAAGLPRAGVSGGGGDGIGGLLGGARPLAEGVDFPKLPEWTETRPYLTGAHLGRGEVATLAGGGKPLSEYSTACQELLIIDDLMYAMMGVEGRYVHARRRENQSGAVSVSFVVAEGLESSLLALVQGMLPLCSAAAAVSAYVESQQRFEGGLVSHALAAEMQELLHDWQTMVVQLEHQRNLGRLSLQAAWFYCQPAVAAMELLAAVAARATSLRGAPLLNLLHREAADRAGDAAARELLLRLLRAASAPYARAVERWVYEGRVDDPYDEFLVLERAHLRKESLAEDYNAAYWTQRYTLRAEVPIFLGGDLAEKVLTTGKYLNAMRESSFRRVTSEGENNSVRGGGEENDAVAFALPPVPPDGLGRIALAHGGGTHAARINAAFKHASNGLLGMVLKEGDLHARLCSLKRYFLLDKGDFLVHFVDIAGEELAKKAPDIAVNKLQSLLELSLKLSTAAADPHNEDLTCALERQGIIHQLLSIHVTGDDAFMGGAGAGVGAGRDGGDDDGLSAAMTPKEALRLTGMETFVLDYRAPWPVSLVLSRRALTKYQLLFRHVFHCKHVERQLCRAWQTHQATRAAAAAGGGEGNAAGCLGRAYILSQRMLHFLQNFTYYLMCEVVEPNWHQFENALGEARTVDELIDLHESFLDACMKEGMLFWPKILKRLEKIKSVCLKFVAASATLAEALEPRGGRRDGRRRSVGRAEDADGAGAPRRVTARDRMDARVEAAAAIAATADDKAFITSIMQLEGEFDSQLHELLQTLNNSAHLEPNLASLCARLDFNEFYTFGPGGKYT